MRRFFLSGEAARFPLRAGEAVAETPPFHRFAPFLVLVVALHLAACLDGELEGQPCAVEKDCWSTQECKRTPQEEALDLDGLCLPRDKGCEHGQQLGCECDPADFEADCSSFAVPPRDGYPEMMCDMTMRVCVAVRSEEQMTMPSAEESST